MTKTFTPFSNATDAMTWQFDNCDKCKQRNCNSKRNIELGFIRGTITMFSAEYIGITYGRLNHKCDHFTTEIQKQVKKEITNNPKLF